MIIVLPATKDTYITNLKTTNIDAITSNVGVASTLDLFKLYNENKDACSSAVLKFDGDGTTIANNAEEFTLIDSLGNSVTFITNIAVNTQDGSVDVAGKVILGLSDTIDNIEADVDNGKSGYAEVFKNVINNVSGNANGLTLEITAFSNSNNELILKQNNSGASGDTTITLPAIDYVTITSNSSDSFARKETSAILLDFDIAGFKSEFMNGVNFGSSAFNNLIAEVILHDVSTGQTKPRNYTLSAFNLTKDFEEGIGKDTIHFSDLDEVANFTRLNSNTTNNSFKIPGHVSFIDDTAILDKIDGAQTTPTCLIEKGDEDAIFDITDYFKGQVENTPNNKGILITFDSININNEKTYFVKRFGSRHLLNKNLVPILKISIPDYDFTIPKRSQFSKRFLDSEETFYLFNRSNRRLTSFSSPDNATLKFRIISIDKKTTYVNDIATSNATNYKGNNLTGIKKATISKDHLSRFSSDITGTSNLEKTAYKKNVKDNFYFLDPDNLDAAGNAAAQNDPETQPLLIQDVNSSDFFINNKKGKYDEDANGDEIIVEDDLNPAEQAFPVIDNVVSASVVNINNDLIKNNKLETFINWYWDDGTEEYIVLEEKVTFHLSENSDDQTYSNLVSRIKFENTSLNGDNTINEGHVYFLDTRSSLEVVKVPFDILSENLGEVMYQLVNVDNKKILYDYSESTKLFYDGEKYVFNFCLPDIYKNFRVKFNFKVNNQINDNNYIIKNKEIFRVE